VSFAVITLCVASQRVFIVVVVVVDFVIESVRKLLDTTSYRTLSPGDGASSGYGWMRRPPDMENSCEYIE
jgi:hypothetical protein